MQIDLAKKITENVYSVEGLESHVRKLLGKREKAGRRKPLKINIGDVTMIFKDRVLEAWRTVRAAMDEAAKKLEKEGLPEEVLPALLKN